MAGLTADGQATDQGQPARGRVRFGILAMLFFVTTINYADRATISIAGPQMADQLGLSAVQMGLIFSAFAWTYAFAQIPGGWLLDRFGSKWIYFVSILTWSILTSLQGISSWFPTATAVTLLVVLRRSIGVAEAPSFPANSRIVSTWFPTAERGTAAAIFNSAQYFATVLFAPLMGWIVHSFGWQQVFWVMGGIGIVAALVWLKVIYPPTRHPRVSRAEVEQIAAGGALIDLEDQPREGRAKVQWRDIGKLVSNRMLLGIFLAQYCITCLTYFFLTWFPIYLVKERGMSILEAGFVAILPALCGFIGGVAGGMFSDRMLKRGYSISFARKLPIVAGMLLSTSMALCNYVSSETLVVVIMAFAFFGKGIGALGWAVVSDTAPRRLAGLCGGVFNTFGNVAGITTPLIIGYIIDRTGSFDGALVFVSAHAVGAILIYLLMVGRIERAQID